MPIHLGDGAANKYSPRRAMIRKTSLLHKIDPTALRSSFADVSGISHRMTSDPQMEKARRT
jgi:hypothetical protein